jgi:hypothetical protein
MLPLLPTTKWSAKADATATAQRQPTANTLITVPPKLYGPNIYMQRQTFSPLNILNGNAPIVKAKRLPRRLSHRPIRQRKSRLCSRLQDFDFSDVR